MPNIDLYFLRFYGGKIQFLLKFKRGKRGGVKFLAKIHLKMTPKSTIKIYLVYCLRPGAFIKANNPLIAKNTKNHTKNTPRKRIYNEQTKHKKRHRLQPTRKPNKR